MYSRISRKLHWGKADAVDHLTQYAVARVATERYTTPDSKGNFYFYNFREGDYNLAVDEKTLPEYAVMNTPDHVSVLVRLGQQPKFVDFQFEIRKPGKPVRKILPGTIDEQPRQR